MPDEIDLFLEANKLDTAQKGLLTAYRDHLMKRGQYVEQGDLKKQFIEKMSVKDVNKVPIDIAKCLVCGHEDYEVKKADA
jgi:hypothetical protein